MDWKKPFRHQSRIMTSIRGQRAAGRLQREVAASPRKNHFPGLEFISQEAAEQLSDPIGNKTSGHW